MASTTTTTALHECPPEADDFRGDVRRGLAATPKQLPCKYLYDATGSRLFDRICELEEYYPTRTEQAIMDDALDEICALLGAECLLVEFGSGSSMKTRALLERLERPAGYVPIDISREHLLKAADALQQDFPHIPLHPVWADYTADVSLPREAAGHPHRVVYFPGSTIGNFLPDAARAFLGKIATFAGSEGGLLVGVDLKKDPAVLERAYDDAEGVTAAFNLNLLARMNRELGATFPVERFEHRAVYDEAAGRVEMHLVSLDARDVALGDGTTASFAARESIWTECSHKYTVEEFAALAAQAGFEVSRVWTDPESRFSVQYLRVR
jgi:dimethylhistidine N-methyltransferase